MNASVQENGVKIKRKGWLGFFNLKGVSRHQAQLRTDAVGRHSNFCFVSIDDSSGTVAAFPVNQQKAFGVSVLHPPVPITKTKNTSCAPAAAMSDQASRFSVLPGVSVRGVLLPSPTY
jgi:hypothetical protein